MATPILRVAALAIGGLILASIVALALLASGSADASLIERLGDPDPESAGVASALVIGRGVGILDDLYAALDAGASARQRLGIVVAISRIGVENLRMASRFSVLILSDDSEAVRHAAALYASRLPEFPELLLEAFVHASGDSAQGPFVRIECIRALGRVGDRLSLSEIGDIKELVMDPVLGPHACETLAAVGSPATFALPMLEYAAATVSSEEHRELAAAAFAKIKKAGKP